MKNISSEKLDKLALAEDMMLKAFNMMEEVWNDKDIAQILDDDFVNGNYPFEESFEEMEYKVKMWCWGIYDMVNCVRESQKIFDTLDSMKSYTKQKTIEMIQNMINEKE